MIRRWLSTVLSACIAIPGVLAAGPALSQPSGAALSPEFHPRRLLVQWKSGQRKASLHSERGNKVVRHYPDLQLDVLELPESVNVLDIADQYRASGLVDLVEPDYVAHATLTPNDPHYVSGAQWPLNNTGQNNGIVDADIDAPEAWNVLTSARGVIVAIIDTGARYTHEDLAANMWRNPGEIPGNGIDDDRNGYIDDVFGINSITGSGNPADDNGHGTHVAGIIGAVGNNGKGITGVAWEVQLMPLKFLDSGGDGLISDAIECINYARAKGAKIINASWNSSNYSAAFFNALNAARAAGIIVVCSAGNDAANLDQTLSYPPNFALDNLVVVAATTRHGLFDPSFSNYGASTVDIGAPGVNVYSTWFGSDSAYTYLSGTSMAAPHVAGVLALLKGHFVSESHTKLIDRLITTTDASPTLIGRTRAGGTVNLRKALGSVTPEYAWPPRPPTLVVTGRPARGWFQMRLVGEPGRTYVLQGSIDMKYWAPVATNTTAIDGSALFTDTTALAREFRFYRAVALP